MGLRTAPIKIAACLALCVATAAAYAEVRTFDLPDYQGAALAYCSADGTLCGADLAREWCINEGYERATNWVLMEEAGVVLRANGRRVEQPGFRSITCSREETNFRMPTLGPIARSTVITPNLRSVEASMAPVEFRISVPGCHQREPGVFLCETVRDYQHCRTLHRSGRVFGCRAGVAFQSAFADPVAAASGTYDLDVESSAVATVRQERRGKGKVRGSAEFSLAFAALELPKGRVCLQRDRYLYHPTGPMGGIAAIDATDECDAPLTGEFEPHEDDLLRAYDMCNAMGAWGETIEQPIELLVAGLYHVVPEDYAATVKSGTAPSPEIVAPYLTVRAPMTVNCEL